MITNTLVRLLLLIDILDNFLQFLCADQSQLNSASFEIDSLNDLSELRLTHQMIKSEWSLELFDEIEAVEKYFCSL